MLYFDNADGTEPDFVQGTQENISFNNVTKIQTGAPGGPPGGSPPVTKDLSGGPPGVIKNPPGGSPPVHEDSTLEPESIRNMQNECRTISGETCFFPFRSV